jgi:type I restriction enzyme R subunit
MTEFKQIVGRGTRVHEDTKKFYFTLIDFRGASNHFADPDFDGPVQIYEPGPDGPIAPPDDLPAPDDAEDPVPPTPGPGETIIDDPNAVTFPAPAGRTGKIAQARHRKPARFHQNRIEKTLLQPG